MGAFVKGDVVVAPFPFSDLSAAKKRPALVVATPTGDDVILCQITSQAVADSYAIPLTDRDFTSGSLRQASHIRPNRLFTAESSIILYRAGQRQQSHRNQYRFQQHWDERWANHQREVSWGSDEARASEPHASN